MNRITIVFLIAVIIGLSVTAVGYNRTSAYLEQIVIDQTVLINKQSDLLNSATDIIERYQMPADNYTIEHYPVEDEIH